LSSARLINDKLSGQIDLAYEVPILLAINRQRYFCDNINVTFSSKS